MSINKYQQYWFPGSAEHRFIFDFTQDVLQIEQPGFPLDPVDSENFGNAITLPDGSSYAVLGKYIMDGNSNVVNNTTNLLDAILPDVANCVFAPDMNNSGSAEFYFIDIDGLHYSHIKKNLRGESSADIISLINVPVSPMPNSPLSIIGNSKDGGNWLFYISQKADVLKLNCVYCKQDSVVNYTSTLVPLFDLPVCIDISNDNIALVRNNASVTYGKIRFNNGVPEIYFTNTLFNLSNAMVQSAFSADGNSLLFLTEESQKHYINIYNITSQTVVKNETVGKYRALKCGPDRIIYGLSVKTLSSSTLLMISPTQLADNFSISESISGVNGGYFPGSSWQDLPL